jgi:hypothetical protein
MTQTLMVNVKEYVAIDQKAEVNGTTILSTIQGSAAKDYTKQQLQKAGLPSDINPNSWYPQQKWLDALKIIHDTFGPLNLKMIGRKIPETANFPPQINSIEAGLDSIGAAYQMNHRGGEIGYYRYQKTGPREGYVEANNPFPCDFDLGIVDGMAKRFAPTATITHIMDGCRKNGANFCRYKVKW